MASIFHWSVLLILLCSGSCLSVSRSLTKLSLLLPFGIWSLLSRKLPVAWVENCQLPGTLGFWFSEGPWCQRVFLYVFWDQSLSKIINWERKVPRKSDPGLRIDNRENTYLLWGGGGGDCWCSNNGKTEALFREWANILYKWNSRERWNDCQVRWIVL